MSTLRIDVTLVERGFFESRAKAQEAIAAGLVSVDGKPVKKPSEQVGEESVILASAPHPWVSRAGLKLVAGLDAFKIDPTNRVCLDIGASTGGFTQVLLSRGAKLVYAVDVGHDQIHPTLLDDDRVVSREGTDARDLTAADFEILPDLLVCDASFISLKKVLAPALDFVAPGAELLVLVKPQFEAGRAAVKKGIVRDADVHQRVCEDIKDFMASLHWQVRGLVPSPIEGGDGNREFLLAAVKGEKV